MTSLYFLIGCVHVTKRVATDSVPQYDSAYVYGQFLLDRTDSDMDIVLILVDAKAEKLQRKNRYQKTSVKRYGLRFDKSDPVYTIAIKPGTYRLKGFEYGSDGRLQTSNHRLSDAEGIMSEEFTVEAGKAYYIGDWIGSGSISPGYNRVDYQWKLDKIMFSFESTTRAFKTKYPAFNMLNFENAFELEYSESFDRNNPETYKLADLKQAISYAENELAVKMAQHLQDSEPDAKAYLAYYFENGIVVEKNLEKAIELYKQAVNDESPVAMWHLGLFYHQMAGYSNAVPDIAKKYREFSFNLIQSAALYGHERSISMQCDFFTQKETVSEARVIGEAWCNVGQKLLNDSNHSIFEDTPVVKGYDSELPKADPDKVESLVTKIYAQMKKNGVEPFTND